MPLGIQQEEKICVCQSGIDVLLLENEHFMGNYQ